MAWLSPIEQVDTVIPDTSGEEESVVIVSIEAVQPTALTQGVRRTTLGRSAHKHIDWIYILDGLHINTLTESTSWTVCT